MAAMTNQAGYWGYDGKAIGVPPRPPLVFVKNPEKDQKYRKSGLTTNIRLDYTGYRKNVLKPARHGENDYGPTPIQRSATPPEGDSGIHLPVY
jgi:hypothetical protein